MHNFSLIAQLSIPPAWMQSVTWQFNLCYAWGFHISRNNCSYSIGQDSLWIAKETLFLCFQNHVQNSNPKMKNAPWLPKTSIKPLWEAHPCILQIYQEGKEYHKPLIVNLSFQMKQKWFWVRHSCGAMRLLLDALTMTGRWGGSLLWDVRLVACCTCLDWFWPTIIVMHIPPTPLSCWMDWIL